MWGPDEPPANPAKALQVVVSRTRTQTAPEVVERAGGGYRLGLDAPAVDALALRHDVVGGHARPRARGDRVRGPRPRPPGAGRPAHRHPAATGPLASPARRRAPAARRGAAAVLGRALSALGDHREALPLLEEAGVGDEDDGRGPAALPGGRARRPRSARPVRAGAPRPRRPARRRPRPDPAAPCTRELLAADNPVRERAAPRVDLAGRPRGRHPGPARAVRESRVVSILGPGGLGKTRLAHLLGQEAEQPVVHFVELVGVASPDDVVGEVGSALGVRDSVSGRRVLTAGAAQRRARADRAGPRPGRRPC